MARAYPGPEGLSQNERLVLRRLLLADGDYLSSRDFATIATVSSGRNEWARPILKKLTAWGLTWNTPVLDRGAATYHLTDFGRDEAEQHGPDNPELSEAAKAALRFIDHCFSEREPLREADVIAAGHEEGLKDLFFDDYISFTSFGGKHRMVHLTLRGQMLNLAALNPPPANERMEP